MFLVLYDAILYCSPLTAHEYMLEQTTTLVVSIIRADNIRLAWLTCLSLVLSFESRCRRYDYL